MHFEDWEWRDMFDLVADMNTIESENERLCRLTVLRGVRSLIPFDAGSFFLADPARTENPLTDPVTVGVPEGRISSYENYYYQYDYCRQFYPITRSMVFCESDFSSNDSSDEMWNNFSVEFEHQADCYIAHDGMLLGCIAIARKKENGDFSERDLEIFKILLPHLENQLYWLYRRGSGGSPRSAEWAAKQYGLTERERHVLFLMVRGKRNQEIARELFISEPTVKKHVSNILRKTDCKNRAQLKTLLSRGVNPIYG